jgi:type IV secretory pathway VirB6-like protein
LASVVATPPSGSAFPVGTNIVNVVATDAVGNTNSCSFHVIVVAGAAPQLAHAIVGTNIVLSWLRAAGCYSLQTATTLSPSTAWTTYTGGRATNGFNVIVTNGISTGTRFYRLSY